MRLQLTIDKLVHGGMGMGTIAGKTIFVPFAAPGDVLDVEITADHGRYAEAKIVTVITPSPERVVPPCPVFGQCGGCQWQHLSYTAQLHWKRAMVIEQLVRIGRLDRNSLETLVAATIPSPREWHYRNRIQLHVDSAGRVGFYRARSKEVVACDQCLIADEVLNARLHALRPEISKRKKGIALRMHEGPSFLQINSAQNERLQRLVAEWLSVIPHRRVLELYAGGGNLTFPLARVAEEVVAIDSDGKAIRLARQTQAARKLGNIHFHCRAAERLTDLDGSFDVVVVDPPRKGLEAALRAIVNVKPHGIIYVSCDPATLARDIARFVQDGFLLTRSQPIDMFPQTYHVETVNLLLTK